MSTTSRLLLIISLVLAAAFLNLSFCAWSIGYPRWKAGVARPIFTIEHAEATDGGRTERSGLFLRLNSDAGMGVVFGAAVPFLMVITATVLVLEWRHSARRVRGGCPRCGYDLRTHCGNNCPECGLAVAPPGGVQKKPS